MDAAIVQRNAFVFCRYSLAVLVWVALLFQSAWVLGAVFVILALSAALKVQNSPMVRLYTSTFGRVVPSEEVILGVNAMRFAHTSGAVLGAGRADPDRCWQPPRVAVRGRVRGAEDDERAGMVPGVQAVRLHGQGGCCALTGKR